MILLGILAMIGVVSSLHLRQDNVMDVRSLNADRKEHLGTHTQMLHVWIIYLHER